MAAVQLLLLSPQFGRALSIHNKVQSVRSRISPRPALHAQAALRDCLDALGNSQSAYAVELASLLTGKTLCPTLSTYLDIHYLSLQLTNNSSLDIFGFGRNILLGLANFLSKV